MRIAMKQLTAVEQVPPRSFGTPVEGSTGRQKVSFYFQHRRAKCRNVFFFYFFYYSLFLLFFFPFVLLFFFPLVLFSCFFCSFLFVSFIFLSFFLFIFSPSEVRLTPQRGEGVTTDTKKCLANVSNGIKRVNKLTMEKLIRFLPLR